MRRARSAAIAGVLVLVLPAPGAVEAAPDAERRAELRRLVAEECTQCHGPGRRGGEGPSLLPSDVRARDREELVRTILHGRDSRMPPWSTRLSEEDVRWIVEEVLTSEP